MPDDLVLAERLMLEAVGSVPQILIEPAPAAWIGQFGGNGVLYQIQCWIEDPDATGKLRSDVLKALWWSFKDQGIEIPFPRRAISLRDDDQFDRLVNALGQRPVENDGGQL